MCDEDIDKLFTELTELADNPEAFEAKRKQLLEANMIRMCQGCPEKLARCRAQQWRIDQELSKYKDPLARYNKMVEMFWTQFSQFQVQLNSLQGELENAGVDASEIKQATAEILQFNNPNK